MQYGGGGIGFVPNQTPPAAAATVTAANNGLRLNGTTVQLGGPLPLGAILVEADSFVGIVGNSGQRVGFLHTLNNNNQFVMNENVGQVVYTMSADDGAGSSVAYLLDSTVFALNAISPIGLIQVQTDSGGSRFIIAGANGLRIDGDTVLLHTGTALANGAAAAAGTLLNAPAAGNPTKWIPVDDNGTTRFVPAW
ncbi:MAG: hypothetical protein V4721_12405 [Bacteroidota bacterium]